MYLTQAHDLQPCFKEILEVTSYVYNKVLSSDEHVPCVDVLINVLWACFKANIIIFLGTSVYKTSLTVNQNFHVTPTFSFHN